MITKEIFAVCPTCGKNITAYTLSNASRTSVRIMDRGGTLLNIWVKDNAGNVADVICGYDTLDGYCNNPGYQGALIGRFGNRIAKGKFTLDGKEYTLYQNNGENALHGGQVGFDKKLWAVTESGTEEEPALILTLVSPDGEEGYPGTLTVTVVYTLTKCGALSIHYMAMTDKATVLNLTNHSYFNLAGYEKGNIGTHSLWLDCDTINDVYEDLIPTGKLLSVDGTPYDFRTEKNLGEAMAADHPVVRRIGGFDNNFNFANYNGQIKHRATLRDPASGRVMKMYTDQPCVQIYSATAINEQSDPFKGNVPQKKLCAVCLETQAMPDSINHEGFTNVVLRPGESYDRTTIYAFDCE